jgi:DNA-binding NarL/FixJ family response regulator
MKHGKVARAPSVKHETDSLGQRRFRTSLLHSTGGRGDAAIPAVRPIRVVIVAAERLFGEALRVLLSSGHGIQVVEHAATWKAAIEAIRGNKPDVVLLDADISTIEIRVALRLITAHSPDSRTLVLTAAGDGVEMARALRAGAHGYVSKDGVLADVTRAIHAVYKGDVWVGRKLFAELLNREALPSEGTTNQSDRRLTVREQQVLRHLASGGTNRRIGEELYISEKTVKTHLGSIFRKLNVTRRLQAVLYAIQNGLREP